jgi:hypothetical protein
MPNNLTDTARKAYQRRRVYVPEWMQLAQWVAIGLIPVVLLISFVVDNDGASNRSTFATPGTKQSTTDDISPPAGRTVSLTTVAGGETEVPSAALDAARRAGLALWTGDWSGVDVDGPAPVTESLYPNAELGGPKVYSSGVDVIIFVFPLDADADGTTDQSFQISVVNNNGSWQFPSAAG